MDLQVKKYLLSAMNALDLVHFDTCDAITTKTISGALYFVTYINNFLIKVGGICTKI